MAERAVQLLEYSQAPDNKFELSAGAQNYRPWEESAVCDHSVQLSAVAISARSLIPVTCH